MAIFLTALLMAGHAAPGTPGWLDIAQQYSNRLCAGWLNCPASCRNRQAWGAGKTSHLAHLLIPGHMIINDEHQLDARVADVAAHSMTHVAASHGPVHRREMKQWFAILPIYSVVLSGVQQTKI